MEKDKVLHFGISFILMVGFGLFFSISIGIILTFLIGLGKEIYDKFYGSGFDIKDLIADLLGILLGTFILLIL